MKNIVLSREEKELTESIERNEWREMKGKKADDLKSMIKKSAFRTKKARSKLINQKVTLNLFKEDIPVIQHIAEEEGLKYQTFIKQIVHKVATGKIKV